MPTLEQKKLKDGTVIKIYTCKYPEGGTEIIQKPCIGSTPWKHTQTAKQISNFMVSQVVDQIDSLQKIEYLNCQQYYTLQLERDNAIEFYHFKIGLISTVLAITAAVSAYVLKKFGRQKVFKVCRTCCTCHCLIKQIVKWREGNMQSWDDTIKNMLENDEEIVNKVIKADEQRLQAEMRATRMLRHRTKSSKYEQNLHERERKQQYEQALRADRPNLQNGQ